MKRHRYPLLGLLTGCLALTGCGSEGAGGKGSVEFSTWGEAYIEEQIPAADFEDGWTVKYSKFLVVIGGIVVADESGAVGAESKETILVNHVSPGVKSLVKLEGIEAKA